jgi:hypothetical protein
MPIARIVGTGMSGPETVVTSALLSRCRRTAAAAVPNFLHEALAAGRIKDGDLVMPGAFGAGFSWASTLLRW